MKAYLGSYLINTHDTRNNVYYGAIIVFASSYHTALTQVYEHAKDRYPERYYTYYAQVKEIKPETLQELQTL